MKDTNAETNLLAAVNGNYSYVMDKMFSPLNYNEKNILIQKRFLGKISLVNIQGRVYAEKKGIFEGIYYTSLDELFDISILNNLGKGIYFISLPPPMSPITI